MFDRGARLEFDYIHDNAQALQRIRNIRYPDGTTTHTGAGLKKARELLFTKADTRPRVAIVLTDGEALDQYEEEATKLKGAGVTVYSVGVGVNIVEEQLKTMATNPEQVIVADFDSIGKLVDYIALLLCPGEHGGWEGWTLIWKGW